MLQLSIKLVAYVVLCTTYLIFHKDLPFFIQLHIFRLLIIYKKLDNDISYFGIQV